MSLTSETSLADNVLLLHPADHYPANQQPVRPDCTLALDREPKVEATTTSLKQILIWLLPRDSNPDMLIQSQD
jgi:hypothetical protein